MRKRVPKGALFLVPWCGEYRTLGWVPAAEAPRAAQWRVEGGGGDSLRRLHQEYPLIRDCS